MADGAVTYAGRGPRVVLALLGFTVGLCLGLPALALRGWLPEAVCLALWFGSVAFWMWRGGSARVVETGEGLRVRNMFRTYDVPWSSIRRVEHVDSVLLKLSCPGVVLHEGGRPLRLLAMAYWTTTFGDEDTPSTERARAAVRRWNRRVGYVGWRL